MHIFNLSYNYNKKKKKTKKIKHGLACIDFTSSFQENAYLSQR